jgi:hypothetical protein
MDPRTLDGWPRPRRPAQTWAHKPKVVANGGLGGFLDVFAWRDGRVRFVEVKFGPDEWRDSQQRFVDLAVELGHDPNDFLLVEVTHPTTRDA